MKPSSRALRITAVEIIGIAPCKKDFTGEGIAPPLYGMKIYFAMFSMPTVTMVLAMDSKTV